MAITTYKKTTNLSMSDIQDMINDLEAAKASYSGDLEKGAIMNVFFALAGFPLLPIAPGGALALWVASLTAAQLGSELQNLINLCNDSISTLEEFEDFLQENEYYDLIKVEMTIKRAEVEFKTYDIATDFNVIALHSTNPPGWSTL